MEVIETVLCTSASVFSQALLPSERLATSMVLAG